MPNLPSSYNPPFFLRNGHLATLWPVLFRPCPRPDSVTSQKRLETTDGDFIDIDIHRPRSSAPCGLCIVSHGLEGNSHRKYVLGMVKALVDKGFIVFAWNMRFCSGVPNRTKFLYHMGETRDLCSVIAHAESFDLPLVLVGFSMGGSQICHYLAQEKVSLLLKGAVVISVPCDLPACVPILDRFSRRIYMHHFMHSLKRKVAMKAAQFPDFPPIAGLERIKTFSEFDDRFTAKINGFASARDYWERCSAMQALPAVRLPLYMLLSQDDPFCPPDGFPVHLAERNPYFHLEVCRYGGHVGFAEAGMYYSERRCVDFLESLPFSAG